MRLRIEWDGDDRSGRVEADHVTITRATDGQDLSLPTVAARVAGDLPDWLAYALHSALSARLDEGADDE